MADEYISKQAFNNAIREAVRKYPNTFYNGLEAARQIAHDMNAADVVPVRHGRWIDTYGDSWTCSACGVEIYLDEDWRKTDERSYQMNYCHYCGAKMETSE